MILNVRFSSHLQRFSNPNIQQASNDKDGVKYVATMIKEANQINLGFPELSVLSKVHRDAEEWVERASIALRSKIPFSELKSLVDLGNQLPLGLTGTLEKLLSRYQSACDWIVQLNEEIPCPLVVDSIADSDRDGDINAKWLFKMLDSIQDDANQDMINIVLDLADEGSRLPVDIDILQLLQTAIDSRNWIIKAKKWLPTSGDTYKRGKIEELHDHLEEVEVIVNNAKMLTDGKSDWKLDSENEISDIVREADQWYEKVRFFHLLIFIQMLLCVSSNPFNIPLDL